MQRIGRGEPCIEVGQAGRARGGVCRPFPGETGSEENGFAAEKFLGLRHPVIERSWNIRLGLLANDQKLDPIASQPSGILDFLVGLIIGLSPGALPGWDGFIQSCSGLRPRLYLGSNPVWRRCLELGVGRLID